jgi:hypothetical protein
MPKLTAEHAARLTALGDGWEDSDAPVTINARDAAALGVPVDQHELTGEPLAVATVKGHDLFLATRDLQVTG